MRYVVAAFILLSAGVAHAGGGIELDEHDAKGVGTAGAQTAIADNPAAGYYNPAGLAFQSGFGAMAGGNLIIARTHVDPDNITLWHPVFAPHFFLTQRFGKYVAFGIGSFAEYGEHFDFGSTWRGRFSGWFVDLTTANINPNLAFRLTPWLAIGGGLDVVLGSIDLYRALQFGGAEGSLHIGGDALGFGGNVAILVKLIPGHLNLGFSYRSRVDMDFSGHGAISAPPELRGLTGGLQDMALTLPLPHHFSAATGFFWGHLQLDAELKVSLYRDIQQLTVNLTDPASGMVTTESVPTKLHNTWGLAGGAQYGFMADRLKLRLGIGYTTTPVPTSTLGPILPDTNRVYASIGFGYTWRWLTVDAAYLVAFLLKTTSTNPDLIATYDTFGQVLSLSVSVHFPDWLQHRPPPPPENE